MIDALDRVPVEATEVVQEGGCEEDVFVDGELLGACELHREEEAALRVGEAPCRVPNVRACEVDDGGPPWRCTDGHLARGPGDEIGALRARLRVVTKSRVALERNR